MELIKQRATPQPQIMSPDKLFKQDTSQGSSPIRGFEPNLALVINKAKPGPTQQTATGGERKKKAKKGEIGIESDDPDEDGDAKKVKRPKRAQMILNVADVINKSRNMKSQINYEQKSRIFHQD